MSAESRVSRHVFACRVSGFTLRKKVGSGADLALYMNLTCCYRPQGKSSIFTGVWLFTIGLMATGCYSAVGTHPTEILSCLNYRS